MFQRYCSLAGIWLKTTSLIQRMLLVCGIVSAGDDHRLHLIPDLILFFVLSFTVEMCRYNKEIAQQFGYAEIAQCWALAEIVATSTSETESESDDMFNQTPFQKNILESLWVKI